VAKGRVAKGNTLFWTEGEYPFWSTVQWGVPLLVHVPHR
jgi:hypothetical protein